MSIIVIDVSIVVGIQQLCLSLREQREAHKAGLWLVDESFQHVGNRLGELGHERFAILAVVIFCHNARLSVVNLQTNDKPELGGTGLQTINAYLMSVLHIARHHSQLIGKGQFRHVAIVGSDACKRVLFVAHGFVKAFADVLDKVHHASVEKLGGKGQCIDKHAESVLDTDVGTSTGNGTDVQFVVACKTGKDQQRSSQRQMGRRHRMFAAELLYGLHVDGAVQFG